LLELSREVSRSDAKLAVVMIPEHLRLAPNWRAELAAEKTFRGEAGELDPDSPARRLREFARRHGIIFLDPAPTLAAYRDRNALPSPYFSFRCDGHLNPLGHFLLANVVARFIAENDLAPMRTPDKKKLLGAVRRNLEASPQAVLGREAYRQIYGGEVYRGSSEIGTLIPPGAASD
ncbi:MAG: hypothetical protein PHF00_06770, partial [Elusimicrobia bacterium]|nr:hypothetical protein [Elusimicrobiota bacterium]